MASTDAEMSVVPIMVADRLGVPVLTNAEALVLDDAGIGVRRELDGATEESHAPLPALVSVTDRSGEARYPSFKAIMAGKKKPVTTWSLADLGIDPGRVGLGGAAVELRTVSARPPRQAGTVITDEGDAAKQLADFLAAHELL
jgi:electron transfer flavoprotein beta subunit